MNMTREEAIERLDRLKRSCRDLAAGMPAEPGWTLHGMALDMALTALRPVSREQVEKVWRSFWEQGDIYDFGDVCQKCGYDSGNEPCRMSFCPACGAPMTDEAVDMVMERLEALHHE